jgi:hypothetical protein
MKKDKLINELESELKTHHTNLHYRIEAKLEFSDEYYDITDMFGTPELLSELKVKSKVIALSEAGYTQLLQLGFKKTKIEKRYEDRL